MSETTGERVFAMCTDCGVLGGHEDTCPRLAGTSEAEPVGREIMIPSEVQAKVREGHTLEPDPPAAMTATRRWTCATCGEAVLSYDGTMYGGATQRTCAEAIEYWGKGGIGG